MCIDIKGAIQPQGVQRFRSLLTFHVPRIPFTSKMSLGDAWRDQPDFENRDPNNINSGLGVGTVQFLCSYNFSRFLLLRLLICMAIAIGYPLWSIFESNIRIASICNSIWFISYNSGVC